VLLKSTSGTVFISCREGSFSLSCSEIPAAAAVCSVAGLEVEGEAEAEI